MFASKYDPYGARVWLGYRHLNYAERRDRFVEQLGSIFIPQTVQQMKAVGLHAYFPMVVPDTSGALPDETALVVYPSQDEYRAATRETVAGRAYGALHGTCFNFERDAEIPASYSRFPLPWSGTLEWAQPYSLYDEAIDWHQGRLRTLLAERPDDLSPEEFRTTVADVIALCKERSQSDMCIVLCEPDFIAVWEHSASQCCPSCVIQQLARAVDNPIICDQAQPVMVSPMFTRNDSGVDVSGMDGKLLDVRLSANTQQIREARHEEMASIPMDF